MSVGWLLGEEIINGKRTKVVRLEKLTSSAKIDETIQVLNEIDLDTNVWGEYSYLERSFKK